MATFEIRMILRHLYNVGELLNVDFDVQDLFVQVTVVIHLKSTLPRQIHDRRRLFIVRRQGIRVGRHARPSKRTASIKIYSVRLRERSRGNLGVHGV
jgi:hypothetical protein